MLKKYGYVRVGSAVNKIQVGNIDYNVNEIINCIDEAISQGVEILCFPQLSLCGYTAYDMLISDDLYESAIKGLAKLKEYSKDKNIIFIVGSPIRISNNLYNCAVSIFKGSIIGITPKSNFSNFEGYNELRYFSNGYDLDINEIELLEENVLVSNVLIYKCSNHNVKYAIEFNDDLYSNNSVSNITSSVANIIFNLSSLYDVVGKYRGVKELVKSSSVRYNCCYVYTSCGVNESTTDLCYSGASLIVEPSGDITENKRYSLESTLVYQDVDFMRINNSKLRNQGSNIELLEAKFSLSDNKNFLTKKYSKTPFLDYSKEDLDEILTIQAMGLARRVKLLGNSKMVIGVSGGSDSTLAFIVCLKVLDILNLDKSHIIAITMPGLGTSGRTYENAKNLIVENGIELREVSIKASVLQHYQDINHSGAFDIAYENAQARERTQILFDVANMVNGIVVGTGDLSEAALGWCTYNGDHMSNYNVNGSIPKGLVTKLIAHFRDSSTGVLKKTLTDILNTPISPELLPLDESGNIKQDTQKSVGPYVLHDFFLYHFMKYNCNIKKLFFIAYTTFLDQYTHDEIKAVLKIFVRRFFTQQFKRSCMPDGIKATEVGLSPRGDFKLGSDFSASIYLKEVEEL